MQLFQIFIELVCFTATQKVGLHDKINLIFKFNDAIVSWLLHEKRMTK